MFFVCLSGLVQKMYKMPVTCIRLFLSHVILAASDSGCVFQAHLRSADGPFRGHKENTHAIQTVVNSHDDKVTTRRLAVGLPAPSDVIQFDKYFAYSSSCLPSCSWRSDIQGGAPVH